MLMFKCSSTYKAFPTCVVLEHVQKQLFFTLTTFLNKGGNSKNRTKITSILQIYVYEGPAVDFEPQGPEGA